MKSKPLSLQRLIRVISVALVGCLLCEQSLWAAGDITSVFSPRIFEASQQKSWLRQARDFENGERIIHIQDAHASLGAQKSIAGTLESLIKDYQVGLVGVEGSEGQIDTALISSFPQKKIRSAVAESLLKQTKISGAEFHKIVSGSNVELYGLEDASLYGENVQAYQKLLRDGALIKTELSKIFVWVEKIQKSVFSADILELGRQSRAHRDQAGSFSNTWQFLRKLARKAGISYVDFPQLKKIALAMVLEKHIRFDRAENQRDLLIKDLESILPSAAFQNLVLKTLEFKKGKMSPAQFYGVLTGVAGGRVERVEYADLYRYALYSRVFESVEVFAVLTELETLEKQIYENLLKTADERSLKKLSDTLETLSKLLEGTLSSQDDQFYQKNKNLFEIQTLWSELQKISTAYGVSVPEHIDTELLSSKIPQADHFYQTVKDRNAAILSNLLKQMRAKKQKVAALVAGGFHTEGLSALMNQQRVSYLVMMPSFDEKSGQRPYLTVITQKGSYLDRQVRIQAQKEAIILMLGGAVRQGMNFERAKRSFLASYRRAKEKDGHSFKSATLHESSLPVKISKEREESAKPAHFQNLATQSALNNAMTPEEVLSWTKEIIYLNGFIVADEIGHWVDGKPSIKYTKPFPSWMVPAQKPAEISAGSRLAAKDSKRELLFAVLSGTLLTLISCASQKDLMTESQSRQIVVSGHSQPVSRVSSGISLEKLQSSGEEVFSIPPPSTVLTQKQRQHFLGWLTSDNPKKRFKAFVVFANAGDPAAVEYAQEAVSYQKDEVQSELMELLDGGKVSVGGSFGGSQEQLEKQLRSDGVYVENRKSSKYKVLEAPGWDFGVAASWLLKFLYDAGEEINIRFNEESPSVRMAAAWYLGVVADKLDSTAFQKYRVVEWLVDALNDPDPLMRATSAWAMGRYAKHRLDFFWSGNHRGAEALAKQALGDGDSRARFFAISAMGLAKNAPESEILETALVGVLRKELQSDKKNLYIFAAAAKAVGNQGWVTAVPELLEALTWKFGDDSLAARKEAFFKTILMDALKNIASEPGNREAIQNLLDKVIKGDSIVASGATIEDINHHFIPVLQLLASGNSSLGDIPKHSASLLLDREVRLRSAAAYRLGESGNVIVIPALLKALSADPHSDVKSAVMEALLGLDLSALVYDPQNDPVIMAVGKLLEESDNPLLKLQAIRVLEKRADALAARAIAKVLDPQKQQDPDVLLEAFAAIARFGHQGLSQMPALLNAMDRYQKNRQGVPPHHSAAYKSFHKLSRALEEALYQLSKHDKAKVIEQIQAKIRQAVSSDEQDLIEEVYAPALQKVTRGSRLASFVLLFAAIFLLDFSLAQEIDTRQNRRYKEELFDKNNLYGLEQKMDAIRKLTVSNTAQSLFWENPNEEERIAGALKKILSAGATVENKKEIVRFAVKFFKNNQVLEMIDMVSGDLETAELAFDLLAGWEGPKGDALSFLLNKIDVEWKYDASFLGRKIVWELALKTLLVLSGPGEAGAGSALKELESKARARLTQGQYDILLQSLLPAWFELTGRKKDVFDAKIKTLLLEFGLSHILEPSSGLPISEDKDVLSLVWRVLDPDTNVSLDAIKKLSGTASPRIVLPLWKKMLLSSNQDTILACAKVLSIQPSFYLRLAWRFLAEEDRQNTALLLATQDPSLAGALAEILKKIGDEKAFGFLIGSLSSQSSESSKAVFEKLLDSQTFLGGYFDLLWEQALKIASRPNFTGQSVDHEKLELLKDFSELIKALAGRYPQEAARSFERFVDRSSADERKTIVQRLLPLSGHLDKSVLEKLGTHTAGLSALEQESASALVQALKSPEALERQSALRVLSSKEIPWSVPAYQSLASEVTRILGGQFQNSGVSIEEQVLMLVFFGKIGSPEAFERLVSFYEGFLKNYPEIDRNPAQINLASVILPALAGAFENFPVEFLSYFQNKLAAGALEPSTEYLAQAVLKDNYGDYRKHNKIDLVPTAQRWSPGLPVAKTGLSWEERRLFKQWEEFHKQELSLEKIEKDLNFLSADPRLKAVQERLKDFSNPKRFDIFLNFSYTNANERLLATKALAVMLGQKQNPLADDPGCLAALIKAAKNETHSDVLLYLAFALGSYEMRPEQSQDPRLEAFEVLMDNESELLKSEVILSLPTSRDPGVVKLLETLIEKEDKDSYALLRAVQTAGQLSDVSLFKPLVQLLDRTGYPYFTSQSSLQTAILSALQAVIKKNPGSPTIQNALQNQVKTWGSLSGLALGNGSEKIRLIAIPLALKAGIPMDTGYPYWFLRILTPLIIFPALIGTAMVLGIWRFSRSQQKKHQRIHPELNVPDDFDTNQKDFNFQEVSLSDTQEGARLAGHPGDDLGNLVSLLHHRLEDWAKKIGTQKLLVPAPEIESSILSLFHRIYSTTLVSLSDDAFLSNDFLKQRRKIMEETLSFLMYTIKYLEIQRGYLKKTTNAERHQKIESHEELLAQSARLYHYFLNTQSALETMLAIHRLVNFSHVGAFNYWVYLYILNLQLGKKFLRSYLETAGGLGRVIESHSYPKENLESSVSDYISKLREKKKREPRSYEQSSHELREAIGLASPLVLSFGFGMGTFYSWFFPFILNSISYFLPLAKTFLGYRAAFKPVRDIINRLKKESGHFTEMYLGRSSKLVFIKKARRLFGLGLKAVNGDPGAPALDFMFFMVGEKTDTDYVRRFKEGVAKSPFFPKGVIPVFIPADAYRDQKNQTRPETGSLFGSYKAFRFIEHGMSKNDLIVKLLKDPDIRELNPGLQEISANLEGDQVSLRGAVIYAGGTAEQKSFILEPQDSLGKLASLALENRESGVLSLLDMAVLQAVAVGMENKASKEGFVVNVEADALFVGDPMKVTKGINLQTALAGFGQATDEGMGAIIPDKNNHILEFIEKGSDGEIESVFRDYQDKGLSNPSPYTVINYRNKKIPQLLVYASLWTVTLNEPFLKAVHRADAFTREPDPQITEALTSLQSTLGKMSTARFLLVPLTILLRKQNGIQAYRASIETKIDHSGGKAGKKVVEFLHDLFQKKYLKAVREGERSLFSFKVASASKHDFFSKGSLKTLESFLLEPERKDELAAPGRELKRKFYEAVIWLSKAWGLARTAFKEQILWIQTQWVLLFDRKDAFERKELALVAAERGISALEKDNSWELWQKIRASVRDRARLEMRSARSVFFLGRGKIQAVFRKTAADVKQNYEKNLSRFGQEIKDYRQRNTRGILDTAHRLKNQKRQEFFSQIQDLKSQQKEKEAALDRRYQSYFELLKKEFQAQVRKEEKQLLTFNLQINDLKKRSNLSRFEKRALQSFESASKAAEDSITVLKKQVPTEIAALKSRMVDEKMRLKKDFRQEQVEVDGKWKEWQGEFRRILQNKLGQLDVRIREKMDQVETQKSLDLAGDIAALEAENARALAANELEFKRSSNSIRLKAQQEMGMIEQRVKDGVRRALSETPWRRVLKLSNQVVERLQVLKHQDPPVEKVRNYLLREFENRPQTQNSDGGVLVKKFSLGDMKHLLNSSPNGVKRTSWERLHETVDQMVLKRELTPFVSEGRKILYEAKPNLMPAGQGARLVVVISKEGQDSAALQRLLSTVRHVQQEYPRVKIKTKLAGFGALPKLEGSQAFLVADQSVTPEVLMSEIRKAAANLYRQNDYFPEMTPYDLAMLESLKVFYEHADYTLSSSQVSKVSKKEQYVVVTESVLKNEVIPFELQRKMLLSQLNLRPDQLKVVLAGGGHESEESLRQKGVDMAIQVFSSKASFLEVYKAFEALMKQKGQGVVEPDQVRIVTRGELVLDLQNEIRDRLLRIKVIGRRPSSWILVEAFKHHDRGREVVVEPKIVDWDKIREIIELMKQTQTFA